MLKYKSKSKKIEKKCFKTKKIERKYQKSKKN